MSESNSDSVILKSPSFCSADTLKDLSHSTAMNQSNDPISLNVQKKDSNDQSIRENSLESDQNTSIRVESVIKSPVKLINPQTPVIKVIDTAKIENKNVDTQQNDTKAETNHDNKVETIVSSTSTPRNSFSSSTFPSSTASNSNFLQPISNILPNNPFLLASSIHNTNDYENSENNPETSEMKKRSIFDPPKLIPNSLTNKQENNIFQSTFSSFLSSSSNSSSSSLFKSCLEPKLNYFKEPSETISSSKAFISLNKNDILQIKTPEFIRKASQNVFNGDISEENEKKDTEIKNSNDNSTITTENLFTTPGKFLFGEKLQDRVVFDSSSIENTNKHEIKTALINDNTATSNSATLISTTASPNMVNSTDRLISFSDVSNNEQLILQPESTATTSLKLERNNLMKNGSDQVFKRKYEVITGEEDEENVLTIYGKLYAWDTDKTSWVEKGRGHLRLNDIIKNDKLCSRLVMRTVGALRLILNANIVAGMTFELANENCLRFTYVDGIYMLKGNAKDIDQLHSAIENRLREISKRIKTYGNQEQKEENDAVDKTNVDVDEDESKELKDSLEDEDKN
ncbi:hypothetical protein SSS_03760 [Sarcoptes scabiei]|uniref:Ran-binding protein 3 n=2 Tax=Sarcoptes scabiei TaxID=52283 RepID=A0A834R1D2_SARSC|nr:hypothetical protein SSS_03760 [Sarcoptes scabiei]